MWFRQWDFVEENFQRISHNNCAISFDRSNYLNLNFATLANKKNVSKENAEKKNL